METNHADCQFINTIQLSSEKKLKCRKCRANLHYDVPNVNRHPEKYAHLLLLSSYPLHLAKLQESGVIDAITRNR